MCSFIEPVFADADILGISASPPCSRFLVVIFIFSPVGPILSQIGDSFKTIIGSWMSELYSDIYGTQALSDAIEPSWGD